MSNPHRTVDWLIIAQDEIAFAVRILTHPEPLSDLDKTALRAAFRSGIRALLRAMAICR